MMDSLFNPVKLGAIGALGILILVVNLLTGTLVVMATGIMASGAFLMMILGPLLYVLSRLILPKFGAATLVGLVYGVASLAFPIMGPPGFFPKLIIAAGEGFGVDIVFLIIKNKDKLASIIAGLVGDYLAMFFLVGSFKLFLPPAVSEGFLKMLPAVLIAILFLGTLGGYLAWLIFQKIKDRKVIVKLQQ
jgi:hypothetical protein